MSKRSRKKRGRVEDASRRLSPSSNSFDPPKNKGFSYGNPFSQKRGFAEGAFSTFKPNARPLQTSGTHQKPSTPRKAKNYLRFRDPYKNQKQLELFSPAPATPPKRLSVCQSRSQRREVMFAQKSTGSGQPRQKQPVYTQNSKIRCKGRK
jgi:hypothetical protein